MQRSLLEDGALALALTALGVVEVLSTHRVIDVLVADPEVTVGPLGLDLILAALTSLPVVLRRRWPVAIPAAVFTLQVAANLIVPHHFAFFAGLGTLALLGYTLGRHADPRFARLGWLGPVAWAVTLPVHTVSARDPASLLYAVVLLGLPWLVGRVIRRLHDQRLKLDAALTALASVEAERREAALLAERTRIAREMHDVLAHGVSVMVVQAGAARLDVAESSPAYGQLLAVEQTGRRVLDELRRTVGLLRSGTEGDDVTPAPGLSDLQALVETMRASGLEVELTTSPEDLKGLLRPDPARELVAYRVVQEALTNSLRHAGSTRAWVELETSGPTTSDLVVRISDAGAAGRNVPEVKHMRPGAAEGRAAQGGGFGMTGLRERVGLYGGTLRAEPTGDGFVTEAVIPWTK